MDQMIQTVNDITREVKGIGYALDNLEVKGRQNMDIVLGCIQHLDQLAARLGKVAHDISEMSKPVEPAAEPEE